MSELEQYATSLCPLKVHGGRGEEEQLIDGVESKGGGGGGGDMQFFTRLGIYTPCKGYYSEAIN